MTFNFKMMFVVLLYGLFVFVQSANATMKHHEPRSSRVAGRRYAPRSPATSAAATQTPSQLTQRPQANAFNFNLAQSLPRASTKYTALDAIPDFCLSTTVGPNAECKATMTATSVTFDDCGDPFTICRCSDAQMSMDEAVDRFARVPTGLRRYIGNMFIMGDNQTHAYTLTNGDIHMFNDCQMETWLHESTHAFDFASGQGISRSQGWTNALQSDSCVPDTYAQTNPTEDFAQVAVIKIYEMARGELPPGFDFNCMANQIDFMDNLPLFDEETLFGNTCDVPDTDGFTGARKIKAPASLNTTKVFPIPDAPPVDFPSVSASIQAKKISPSATADPAEEPEPTNPVVNVGENPTNGRIGSGKSLPNENAAKAIVPDNLRWFVGGVVVLTMSTMLGLV